MSKIDDNKKLILINIPGTHDSAACYMNRISFNLAKTQDLNISGQLNIGIRNLDIRVTKGSNEDMSEDEDIICCHGICDCYVSPNFGDNRKVTYKSVLLDIRKFLEDNPSETVLMGTYRGRGKDFYVFIRAHQILSNYVGDICINFRHDLTMKEARGKIINYTLLDTEFDKDNMIKMVRGRSILNSTGINDVHSKYQNCATFKTNGNLKVREMKDMFEIYKMTLDEAEIKEKNKQMRFPISYSISCTGEYDGCLPNPLKQAIIVHSFIQKEDVFKKGYYYGWLNMDFANIDSTSKLINSNFNENDKILIDS